jgi:histidinol-phosphate aminotransferase
MESQPFDPLDLVRPDLRAMEKYVGVLPLEVVAAEIGVGLDEIVKLDANENLYGVLPEILREIGSANHHIYPDPSQTFLRRDLAAYMNVSDSMIVAGAGSDDLIDIVIRLVRPGPVLISTPTFGMYSFLSNIAQLPVIDVPRGPPPTFFLDIPEIVSAIRQRKVSVVFLVSPNNPTGTLVSNEEVETICQERTLVVVDEAYAEFSGVSAASLVTRFPNLIILRTFSKWSGLAGLRAGFAVASEAIANVMMSIKQPYNINVAADVACRAALAHRVTIQTQIDAIVYVRIRNSYIFHLTYSPFSLEREYLRAKLAQFDGLSPLESASNFFLCKVQNAPFTAKQLRLYLRRLGVLIRYFEKPAFMSDFIRISAGRRRDSDELLRCVNLIYTSALLSNPIASRLKAISAVFFDMDGVLADESSSYRSAIILTARSYGTFCNAVVRFCISSQTSRFRYRCSGGGHFLRQGCWCVQQ